MVRHTAYEPGTPSWADVTSPDPDAARAFYGALFGWTGEPATEDCDAASARVTELGGEVCVPPTDIPPGRFAVVNDPTGATFTIIALNPEVFG